MTDCDLCQRAAIEYNFSNVCCRVRFLLSLPLRSQRVGWLKMWEERDGIRMAREIEQEVRRRWGGH